MGFDIAGVVTSHGDKVIYTHPFVPVIPNRVRTAVEGYSEPKGRSDDGGEEDAYKTEQIIIEVPKRYSREGGAFGSDIRTISSGKGVVEGVGQLQASQNIILVPRHLKNK